MPRSRDDFHDKLVDILGSKYVYFQPPEDVKLHYPCIIYNGRSPDIKRANNQIYGLTRGYDIVVITDDPDDATSLSESILAGFQMSSQNGDVYTSDGLYHVPLIVYF